MKIVRFLTWAFLGFSLVALGFVVSRRAKPPVAEESGAEPIVVPAFSLVDQSSATVTSDSLKGKVWVASFIFTRCQGPCPMITQKMKQLTDEFPQENLRFVSFTVDPGYDKPDVLKAYAEKTGATDSRWMFLSGEPEAEADLIRKGFLLTLTPEGEKNGMPEIAHSTRLALVDRDGRIDGTFDAFDVDGMRGLRDELRRLKP